MKTTTVNHFEYLEDLFRDKLSHDVLKVVADIIEKNFDSEKVIDILKSLNFAELDLNQESSKPDILFGSFIKIKENAKKHPYTKNYHGKKITQNGDEKIILVIEKFMHPLSHMADIDEATNFAKKIEKALYYDGLVIEKDVQRNSVILYKEERDLFIDSVQEEYFHMHSGEALPEIRKVVKKATPPTPNITSIEILEDETGYKNITIYINTNYENPRNFRRGINWDLLYNLALNKIINYKRGFFDYFNSNKANPLYSKKEFKVTQILKKEKDNIVPNIKIEIITQKAVTQRRLKTA